MSEWQPIETAPRDGTPVLLLIHTVEDCLPGRMMPGYVRIGSYRKTRTAHTSHKPEAWRPDSGSDYDDRERLMPTHWQPLPEPPATP